VSGQVRNLWLPSSFEDSRFGAEIREPRTEAKTSNDRSHAGATNRLKSLVRDSGAPGIVSHYKSEI
jgi:hypothetical protein